MDTKIKILVIPVAFLLVFLLSGCFDAGLKRAARKERERKPTEEATNFNQEIENQEKRKEEEVQEAELEEQISAEDIQGGIDEMFKALENMESKEENKESEDVESEEPVLDSQPQNCEGCETFEDASGAEVNHNEENNSANLLDCDHIDVNTCQDNGQKVCAQVRTVIDGEMTEGWLDFQSACAACRINSENANGNTLETINYRLGSCR